MYFRLFFNVGQGQELDTGLLLPPDACVPLVVAIAQVYLAQVERGGQSATGKKPRLRQVVAQQGVRMVSGPGVAVSPLCRAPSTGADGAVCRQPCPLSPYWPDIPNGSKDSSISAWWLPLGRLAAPQLRELAHLAQVYGSGMLRLTPWQNVLIPDVPDQHVSALHQAIAQAGSACVGDTSLECAGGVRWEHGL